MTLEVGLVGGLVPAGEAFVPLEAGVVGGHVPVEQRLSLKLFPAIPDLAKISVTAKNDKPSVTSYFYDSECYINRTIYYLIEPAILLKLQTAKKHLLVLSLQLKCKTHL